MIVKECRSTNRMCPCMKCNKYCCLEDEFDTKNLCETAREYCESANRDAKEGGVNGSQPKIQEHS